MSDDNDDKLVTKVEVTQEGDDIMVDLSGSSGDPKGTVYRGPN